MADIDSEKKDEVGGASVPSEIGNGKEDKDEMDASLDQHQEVTEKENVEGEGDGGERAEEKEKEGEKGDENEGEKDEKNDGEKEEKNDGEKEEKKGGEGDKEVDKVDEGEVKDSSDKKEREEDKMTEAEENGGTIETSVDSEDRPVAASESRGDSREGEEKSDGGATEERGNETAGEAEEKEEGEGREESGLPKDGEQDTSDVMVEGGGEDGGLGGKEGGEMFESGVGLEPLEDIIEEEEEEEEEEEPVDREELIAGTKELLVEQERLKSLSGQLQHKIAEYLAKKKTEERPDPGRNVTDQEKRYTQCMGALEVLERELSSLQQKSELQESNLKVLREQKLAEVQQATGEFAGYKKATAVTALHSRTGRRLQGQEVEQFQAAEDKKELELIQVRLENIKLQNKISKLETQIKEKEQLAEGLHMIDFEQLKINNVDLNEKIEERNEDILKLRKKVTSTVQVLTHVKEKLQFLQAENGEKRMALRNVDEIVAKKRDHLTRTKQARDALRTDNLRLKQKGGLVGHTALLGDFEERKDQNDELKVHLESLQQRHSELTVVCDGLRKKVEQSRAIHPRNI